MDISIIVLSGIAVALAALIVVSLTIYLKAKEHDLELKAIKPIMEEVRRHNEPVKRNIVKHKGTPQHILDNANRTHSFTRQRSAVDDYDSTPNIVNNSVYIDSSTVYDTPTTRSYDSYDSCSSSSYSSSDSSSCSSSSSDY